MRSVAQRSSSRIGATQRNESPNRTRPVHVGLARLLLKRSARASSRAATSRGADVDAGRRRRARFRQSRARSSGASRKRRSASGSGVNVEHDPVARDRRRHARRRRRRVVPAPRHAAAYHAHRDRRVTACAATTYRDPAANATGSESLVERDRAEPSGPAIPTLTVFDSAHAAAATTPSSLARTSFMLVLLAIAGRDGALPERRRASTACISLPRSAQRSREIGIRFALGARAPAVKRMFVLQGLAVARRRRRSRSRRRRRPEPLAGLAAVRGAAARSSDLRCRARRLARGGVARRVPAGTARCQSRSGRNTSGRIEGSGDEASMHRFVIPSALLLLVRAPGALAQAPPPAGFPGTPPPSPPVVIRELSAEPATIQAEPDSHATLRWEVSNAYSLTIEPGIGVVATRGTRRVAAGHDDDLHADGDGPRRRSRLARLP